jgi:superfamily II DNA or RNA helicase
MPVDWKLDSSIELGGLGSRRIEPVDGERQRTTAEAILNDLRDRPGVVLADEVGMGKTYVALAVAASVISSTRRRSGPVVVMVPSRLRRKWQREWKQFKDHCTPPGSFDWVRAEYAHTPTEFFRLRDDRGERRCHLVFMTTGCFSLGLQDPWIKLAFIRLARRHTKLSPQLKRRIGRWAATLVRQVTARNLTNVVVDELMRKPVPTWRSILVRNGVLAEDADDPVPELLARYENRQRHRLDWRPLCEFVRTDLPAWSPENITPHRRKAIRQRFNEICRSLYEEWLADVPWKAPLLILDEAHHAKNDTTRLAKLFREQSERDIALLGNKFRRMLFLTATPFQLGHHELIQVLRTFGAVLWTGERAPSGTDQQFREQLDKLADALDKNRLAARNLDHLWGKVMSKVIGDQSVYHWWQRIEANPQDAWERRLIEAVQHCLQTRMAAEELLRPWVIRHNRSTIFPSREGDIDRPRRVTLAGRAIIDDTNDSREIGLAIADDAVLPFLLSARAQGELASRTGARAFFAEGLSSSYEAFHHTRDARGNARDMDDEGKSVENSDDVKLTEAHVPTSWYEEQVAALIPSKSADRRERLRHPKVAATVKHAIDLWLRGEKVPVFCVYRETSRALYEHLKEEVEERLIALDGQKLGLDPLYQHAEIENRVERIARRLSEEGRPFSLEVRQILSEPFQDDRFALLRESQQQLVEVLTAYFRSPSFIARYLPLEDPDLREAWELGEGRPDVLNRGRAALWRCIREATDQSDQTIIARVYQFLDFAVEQAERARTRVELDAGEDDDEAADPLKELLGTVSVYSRPRRRAHIDRDEIVDGDEDDGSYRVVPLVRMVFGETPPDTRDRLALAFNSPLFPEILVSSSVMGEGIDLHRFCRHVIHHDGFWNPSTLEQQTGRLDRIRSKAELCRRPIQVCQPFIAGGADEKMFRVLRDRERWFQVVMGQKFKFDEATSDELATRVPLPTELAERLTFDLARWRVASREKVQPTGIS